MNKRQIFRIDKLGRVPANKVLVRIDKIYKEGDKVGSIIIPDTEWNPQDYTVRYGTVVQVCDTLRMRTSKVSGLEHKTVIEVQEGDVVYFGKIASANAPIFLLGETVYYLLNYSDLIVRKRDDLYPLNGYVLLEKVTEKVRRDGLILDFGDFQNMRLGIVRYVGRKNDYYFGTDAVDADVEVGEEVVFEGNFWTALESEMFRTVDALGYCQRCWIIAGL